jgi:hypothetical protein
MQKFGGSSPISFFELTAKPHPFTSSPLANDVLKPDKRAAADEKDIGRVHLKELLLRVLSATLRRHTGHRSFNNLQQRLLHTFTRNVSGNRRIVCLPRDFIDLVYINDSTLGFLNVVVCSLQKAKNDIFNILANISRLSQAGGIGDGKGNLKKTSQSLR